MSAAKVNFSAEQGSTFTRTLTFYSDTAMTIPLDVSTWVFSGQVRKTYDSTTSVAAFVFTAGVSTNKKVVTITDENMSLIPVDPSLGALVRKIQKYMYDIEATKLDGTTERIFEGAFNVSAEVTK